MGKRIDRKYKQINKTIYSKRNKFKCCQPTENQRNTVQNKQKTKRKIKFLFTKRNFLPKVAKEKLHSVVETTQTIFFQKHFAKQKKTVPLHTKIQRNLWQNIEVCEYCAINQLKNKQNGLN